MKTAIKQDVTSPVYFHREKLNNIYIITRQIISYYPYVLCFSLHIVYFRRGFYHLM